MAGKMAQQPQTFKLDTSGQHLRLVPVRSNTSQTERTTRDAKKNSVRKIKITTTSRQGSQIMVHVDTKIIETSTASKGTVELRRIPQCSQTMVESGQGRDDDLNLKRLESREIGNYEEGVSGDVVNLELIKGNKGERMRESKRAFYSTRDYFTDQDIWCKGTEEVNQNSLGTDCESFDESERGDTNIETQCRNNGSDCLEVFEFHNERPLEQETLSGKFQPLTSVCGEQSSRNTNFPGMDLKRSVLDLDHPDTVVKPSLLDLIHLDTVVKPSLLDANQLDTVVKPSLLDVNHPALSETFTLDERQSLDFGSIWAIGQLVVTERTPRKRISCYRDYLSA